MELRTKRWNDPVDKDDGLRVLVTRYRPRALRKGRETWEEWWKQLAPSAGLLADFHGKHGPPISWDDYRARYLREMELQAPRIAQIARRVKEGERITLLCSSACEDPDFCHRTVLRQLVEAQLGTPLAPEPRKADVVPARFSRLKGWIG